MRFLSVSFGSVGDGLAVYLVIEGYPVVLCELGQAGLIAFPELLLFVLIINQRHVAVFELELDALARGGLEQALLLAGLEGDADEIAVLEISHSKVLAHLDDRHQFGLVK